MLFRLTCATLALGSFAFASTTVNPGWDLFETQAGTTFAGVSFKGVPLHTFNFGGSIGVQNVGNTDTIVQRLQAATAPSTAISIELDALQLVTTAPTNFGLGVGLYYLTLQSARGGPDSAGRMTINFGPEPANTTDPHGTFSSFFDVFFDIHFGALNGPIALSDSLELSSNGTAWTHYPPPGSVQVPGVNTFLNGTDRGTDFWPGTVIESHPTGAHHVVDPASTPEPGTWSLMLGSALAAAAFLKRRARLTLPK